MELHENLYEMIDVERDKRYYNFLGQFAINQLTEADYESFDSIVLELSVQPGSYGLTGHYFIDGKRHELDFQSTWEFMKKLKDFHFETTHDGTSKWNEMIFTVTKEMKFDSKFIWNEEKQNEIDGYNFEAEQQDPNYKRPKWPWE